MNEVNRLKRKEPTFVSLGEVVAVSNPPWADPLRELEDKMLLEEFLALCEPWMQDMAYRRLQGFSWDEIGEPMACQGTRLRQGLALRYGRRGSDSRYEIGRQATAMTD